ncbi:TIGR03619 family F420-dependent LLM class oxidoreductase [Sphingobium sp. CFD-1]|uniref:TIGR03619 family F420-dependent LLM class oxidoreductase n=1 Tax=Sphingobium sp. CFD-1 TaxID=2878545 RepID=UPI00214CFE32|nr:TIGR03619 family F420-dependent LLM class oxidoreductase [Sphingobium sp. CFD-1]
MKINIAIPHALEIPALTQPWELMLDHKDVLRAMKLADDLGFHKCMLGEHFLIPSDHLEASGAFWHHGTVFLAGIAGATERLGLASSINILPLQNAIVQAKAWSTIDWLSGGRGTAVVAVGWLKEEFDLLGVPFRERGAICDEYVQAMIALWTEDKPEFEGKYVSFKDVGYEPKPRNLPLWFGGDAEAPLKRIAKWGDGWNPFLTPPSQFPEALDFIRSQPDYHGRPIELFFPIEAMKLGDGHVENKAAAETIGSWNVQQTIDLCGWLGELGVTETIIPLPPLDSFDAYLDRMRWVAQEIMPKMG